VLDVVLAILAVFFFFVRLGHLVACVRLQKQGTAVRAKSLLGLD